MIKPKISVIIPVYNREKYIGKCIESVLRQDYGNIEIIIIDDGSTDNTKEKIYTYISKNNNIRYYYQENSGVSNARNKGVSYSSGEYVIFLDSDDCWNTSLLRKEIEEILKKQINVCYCGMMKNNIDTGVMKKDKIRFKEGNIIIEFLKEYMNAQTITWLIKKDILIKNNIVFKDTLNYGEDLLFFLKLLSIEQCCCVKEYLAYYNMHEDSLTNNLENQLILPQIFEEYIQWINENKKNILSEIEVKELIKIINSYRIPSNMLRTFFDSIKFYNYDLIEKNKESFKKYCREINIFLGANKIRNIIYIICIKNKDIYNIINSIRKGISKVR